jgi:uncharacterized protein (DUF1015 family)
MLGSFEMADVRPFRALRYDETKAGPLESLVAPPYDVISAEERVDYIARSPYNVVHVTLPDSEEDAARAFAEWQADGVLVRDDEPSYWLLSQDYVGPDGVPRRRNGIDASLRAEPYERRVVLPHERTHQGPKEGRLRLLRAVRAELEPIFLLYDGPALDLPDRPPDIEVEGARLWRVDEAPDFSSTQLLIADGHHRYETALAFAEEGGSPFLMAVLVPTHQEGLTIFPTHRVVERVDGLNGSEPAAGVGEALAQLEELPRDRPAVALYRGGETSVLKGDEPELDAAFVERLGPEGVTYTPQVEDAVAAVDSGRAQAAFLLRAPTIEQVRTVAERGETMPQKSTYFFPKLTSGLLFHPLD